MKFLNRFFCVWSNASRMASDVDVALNVLIVEDSDYSEAAARG